MDFKTLWTKKWFKVVVIIAGVFLLYGVFELAGVYETDVPPLTTTASDLQTELGKTHAPSRTSSGANEPTPALPPDAESQNALMTAEFKTDDVMNGFKTEVIGTRAYINITKNELNQITIEDFVEFIEQRVDGSGHNWVSIICNDGTGIVFAGSQVSNATYGEIDNEGCINKEIGYIVLEDGKYVYNKK